MPDRYHLQTPRSFTVGGYADALAAAHPKLQRANRAQLDEIVGLLFALLASYLDANEDQLVEGIKVELKARGWSPVQIWMAGRLIGIVVELVIAWLQSKRFASPRAYLPSDGLPELKKGIR
jgi:hypothetical protein